MRKKEKKGKKDSPFSFVFHKKAEIFGEKRGKRRVRGSALIMTARRMEQGAGGGEGERKKKKRSGERFLVRSFHRGGILVPVDQGLRKAAVAATPTSVATTESFQGG